MTKKEIEAYRANFEYGRKCWEEFVKKFPPDKPFPKHDENEQRVFGDDPFAPTPKPVPAHKPEPKSVTHVYAAPVATVQPKQRWQDKEISAGWFWFIVLAVCAFFCFPLLWP